MSKRRIATPRDSVNYALVHKGPVPPRKFRVGAVELARNAFTIVPKRIRERRSGVWRIMSPNGGRGRIQTQATARLPRRRDGDLERQLGIPRSDVVNLGEPRYRRPDER